MNDSVKTIYDRHVSIRLSLIVLAGLVIALAIVGVLYALGDEGTKLGSLLGGLVATFIAVLIQFLLTLAHHREIERLKRMGFRDILAHREDRKRYYATLLGNARQHVEFIGKTAHSFLDDFAVDDPGASVTDRLLLDALERGVRMRILVADKSDLPKSKKKQHDRAAERMRSIAQRYPDLFEHGCLSEPPTQTWVTADRRCVFGPVFPSVSSRTTPAIHADSDSPFLEQYTRYFDDQWDRWVKSNADRSLP